MVSEGAGDRKYLIYLLKYSNKLAYLQLITVGLRIGLVHLLQWKKVVQGIQNYVNYKINSRKLLEAFVSVGYGFINCITLFSLVSFLVAIVFYLYICYYRKKI